MEGITLDTGVLIALQRRERRAVLVFEAAMQRRRKVTVPAAVVTEWWRGQRGPIARLLDAVDVEPLTLELAKIAGEAIASVRGATTVDAIVMASAAQREDVVYTADYSDLDRLRQRFPAIKVLRV